MKRSIITTTLLFSFATMPSVFAESFVYYKLKPGQYISEVLSDLGVCPLYGKNGHLKRVLKINEDIDPDRIKPGQELKIPFNFLNNIDEVLFYPNKRIIPKSVNNNVCAKMKNKKGKHRKIINVSLDKNINSLEKAISFITPPLDQNKKMFEFNIEKVNFDEDTESIFEITFNQNAVIQKDSYIFIEINNELYKAKYHSGSNSKILSFKLDTPIDITSLQDIKVTIPKSKADFSIKSSEGLPLKINERTISVATNELDRNLDLSPPKIISLEKEEKEINSSSKEIILTVVYDKPVIVDGAPQLTLNIDGENHFADFSELNLNKVTFKYKSETSKNIANIPEISFKRGSIYSNEGIQAEEEIQYDINNIKIKKRNRL